MTTKTNILALGTTARQSLTVTVEQGDVVSVGVFSSASEVLALNERFTVLRETPGAPNLVCFLTDKARDTQLYGPATYHVLSPITSVPFGVFKEV